MSHIVSFSISAPGAGKGTQAELLAKRKGFIHFDTGRHMERILHSPGAENDPILKREQIHWDTGILTTPAWALQLVREATNKMVQDGYDIAYSGSPRTYFETFGNEKTVGLIATFTEAYGKENVHFVRLDVSEEVSIERNSNRVVCSICSLPILANANTTACAFCGGKPETRILDDPEIIKVRLKEYRERTLPIVEQLKK
jgi:adenylate kinase